MDDLISRQAAIDKWKNDFRDYVNALDLPRDDYKGIMEYIDELPSSQPLVIHCTDCEDWLERQSIFGFAVSKLPSAQTERCEYYALCRHGRDENKLRARLGFCEYCNEDSDGYVRPIEKNSHAWLVRRGRTMKLRVCFKGGYSECDILYCPMCGRRLTDE